MAALVALVNFKMHHYDLGKLHKKKKKTQRTNGLL